MTQQTKSASNRSNSTPSTRGRSTSNSDATAAQPSLAGRLKTPVIAGGAALAGLAGGLVLAKRGTSRKVLGVRVPSAQTTSNNLAEAAKQVGGFGERVGELANEVRLVREGIAHRASRSPVEVVLEGLTSRRK